MSNLYDTDFFLWTKAQTAALKVRNLSAIDWDHLADEIKSLGQRDRREVRICLRTLVRYLLKWQSQPTDSSLRYTIHRQRDRLSVILDDSPSLRQEVPELIAVDYDNVLRQTAYETGLALDTFPAACPWTTGQVLDGKFLPGVHNG